MTYWRTGSSAFLLSLLAMTVPAALQAQPSSAPPPGVGADLAAQAAVQMMEESRAPDSTGTGPYKAIKRQYENFPGFVVYQPADLSALGARKMPVYVFGNGACTEDGASSRQHLLEVASHGYLVIAPGGIYSGPGVTVTPQSWEQHRDKTRYQQLGQAIDWAAAENGRAGSPFKGKIDTAHVAASGYSCGGIQALKYAGDKRVSTFVIMNSGIMNGPVPGGSGEMSAQKSLLQKIDKPTLYVLGGKTDIAYPNGMDDYARLTHIPSAVINTDVTHAGTYAEPNGGRAAQAVVAWLDWQLRGDKAGRTWFVGEDCKLCSDPAWTIESRKLDTLP
ncbi:MULTISPECIES: hypothetical protein [unclassified Sphingobium]|uniref:hypothetical protein n=1 Tax=unclassified Sphingobium TaxID=2611147 RepID=UPI00222472C0|nr:MULTISPECIES: hypothetical protein [unclassified Sphingobium]MCW2410973.1 dienelactone hydrolase [Sphingobium sp. B8D3D]MCW2416736.1 dienelactone hydrolase [Sphingobium sp. B8D3A]